MFSLPNLDILNALIFGMLAMASLVACMVFLRYWHASRDRFFLYFGLSFGIMALNRIGLILVPEAVEGRTLLYWVRLVAYLFILLAIVQKNYGKQRR